MKTEIEAILAVSSNAEISAGIVRSFIDVESAFVLKQWKSGGLDAGHFVEMVRRFLDFALARRSVPVGKTLPTLNEAELSRVAALQGHESYRLLVPRVLYAIYSLRNKRGIGHVSEVTANGMDASLILASCKWVLAELLRVSSNRGIAETSALVDRLSERYIDGFWSEEGVQRILLSGLKLREQVVFYLFNRSPASTATIQKVTEATPKYLRATLRKLHGERLIEFNEETSTATLSPLGHKEAERIIQSKGMQ